MCNEYEYEKEEHANNETKWKEKKTKEQAKERTINGQKCIEPPASILENIL